MLIGCFLYRPQFTPNHRPAGGTASKTVRRMQLLIGLGMGKVALEFDGLAFWQHLNNSPSDKDSGPE